MKLLPMHERPFDLMGYGEVMLRLTPPDKAGMFQGIRMVFWVLIPMVIGPALTAIIQQFSEPSGSYDMNGNPIYNYTPYMFLIAAVIVLFAVIPVVLLNRAKPEEMTPHALKAEAAGATETGTGEAEGREAQ